MPLDPQAKALLEQIPVADMPDFDTLNPAVVRKAFSAFGALAEDVELAGIENRSVPGPAGEIPVRIYTPEGSGPFPLVVFFHGGGFVVCDLDTHDGTCRQLSLRSGCVVVSVDYRLAPEHRFPAGLEDCYAATCWSIEHAADLGVDARRAAVAGDSAGGNLAAAVSLMARDRKGPALVHQLLVYPVTNHAFDTASYRDNAEGYLLSRDMMEWFWKHYLKTPGDGASPLASPLRAESLAALPSATVITAEFDPLRDEGAAYAARLREAGVPTRHAHYDGMFHGFWSMTGLLDRAQEAMDQAAAALREAFAHRVED
jgi:acetyl esterase